NRLGAALAGEVDGPPIMALFVYGANPVTSAPNAGLIVEGLMREELFTVVHEQFMTDTARYADVVLPATTQLEQADLHRAYGHRALQYN
ncbi:molybdopterin-dependent oxidoreductase, partial [Escherichia coli]|uniref:molybdopterin-dependent oxidoreductase n=1 Tax=Escherichia coli TaxID=562 RepID=UPI00398A531A